MKWHELTDVDADRLINAITRSKEFAAKMAVFQSGFIAHELRWLQLSAHELYDKLSDRERQVFAMRIKQHTFPIIADILEISESTAKTYWRRTLAKCANLFLSPNRP